MLYDSRGVSDMTRYDPADLLEKYGLTPEQYPDFAALRGDPSDNLPSIPGVGEKTATKWIAEFGSLEDLVNRVDEVKGKAGDALREHLGSVLRNRQLTTLLRDLPAEHGRRRHRPSWLPEAWDREKIHQLFDTLQFRVLRDRLYQTLPRRPARRDLGTGAAALASPPRRSRRHSRSTQPVLGPDEVAAWLAEHASVRTDGAGSRRARLGGAGPAT